MNRPVKVLVALVVGLVVAGSAFLAGFFSGGLLHRSAPSGDGSLGEVVEEVAQLVRIQALEPSGEESMTAGAVRGLLDSLDDPYAAYFDKEHYRYVSEMNSGQFYGIGVTVTERDGRVVIVAPIEGTPAFEAGLRNHNISNTAIKGDSSTSPKTFDGLQVRLGGAQVVSNGATSGGDPLSLNNLDEAIDAVDAPTHLFMSKAMRRRLTTAARNSGVGGFITYDVDNFGRRIAMYAGLPILIADANADLFATLAFDEAATGGGSTATSIYVLSLGEGMLQGIQNGVMQVTDLGEQDAKPVLRTRVEWYVGLVLMHPRAASRLRDISNAAVVA